ncbi:hypothetical protein AX14_002284 [Amanita brunnescens Koide BX004]|nr:hypothetical protein AX14_002284 [Amanita brunnescens Koide BX004]
MIIQGDFNLPSGIWDPGRNNSSPLSVDLFNHLSDEGFGLANDEGAPTWTNRRGSFSVLDLIFVNDQLAHLEPDVFVNMEGRGRSDHALLLLVFGTTEHWGQPYIPSSEEEEECFIQDLSNSICKRVQTLEHTSTEDVVAGIGADILDSWNCNSKAPRIGAGPNKHITTRATYGHVTLVIDNKAAANSLFNFDVKSSQMAVVRINMLLHSWLVNDHTRSLSIRFAPSHQGIVGNEHADELTKAGLGLCPTNPPHILRSHFIAQQRRDTEHKWQRLWKDATYRGSQWLPIRQKKKIFKPSFAKPARNFFHNMAKGEPSHLSRLAHVLTDHAPTGEYRTRFFPQEPTACPHCNKNAVQTRHHILTECPWYVNKFPSITDWGKGRRNDLKLNGFLIKNPSAFTFVDAPLDVH